MSYIWTVRLHNSEGQYATCDISTAENLHDIEVIQDAYLGMTDCRITIEAMRQDARLHSNLMSLNEAFNLIWKKKYKPLTEEASDPLGNLVANFSKALLEKLRAAEDKYGYKNDWARPDWEIECQKHLAEHLAKGDPRDVAAYAAFCWHHGWPTAPQS